MKEYLLNVLDEYLLLFPNEQDRQKKLNEFLLGYTEEEFTDWNNFDGHIVASGFVYSIKDKKFLVLYHKDLKMYLYPGGHVDKSDSSILDAAKREVKEETGLTNFNLFSYAKNENIPIDIDTHIIGYNERLNLPEHYHFDFRYLFTVDEITDVNMDLEESSDYKWIDINELRNDPNYGNISKKIERIIGRNMKRELDNFIIESDIELDYFDEVVNHIINNEKRILDFFKLERLPQKVTIIFQSYEPFKEFIVSKYGECLEYVAGDSDSETSTIRILNIDDQIKYTTHKDANIEKVKSSALHEIIHQCHGVYHKDYRQTTWFAEGLATNLSNQAYSLIDLSDCDFDKLRNDFRHYKGNYNYSYTIVNYVLNNYSDEEITKLYSDPDYLRERAKSIFEEAKNN